MTDLILSIDAGGTTVKVCVFDLSGEMLETQNAEIETQFFPDGRAERDPVLFWKAIQNAIRKILAGPISASQIIAIGCTGFGNGVFFIDEAGNPTYPGIVSLDHRAQPLVDELKDGFVGVITGNKVWGGQTLFQIANMAKNHPEVFDASRWALSCKDFIRFCLTGEAWTDPTDVSGGGLMNLKQGRYAAEVFERLGAPQILSKLPPIVENSDIAGRVTKNVAGETGLVEGTPLAGSMMDVAACCLGAGVTSSDSLIMIAGTWSINCIETSSTELETAGEFPILNMLHRGRKVRLLAEGSPTSASNLSWFIEQATGGSLSLDSINTLVSNCKVTGERCYFLPYVHGPRPRYGAFLGLQATDNQATMLRAIFEGVAFQHRRHAEEVLAYDKTAKPKTIRLAGGAAKSAIWAQIFADVMGMTVEVSENFEVGALGAAICAAVAVGKYSSLELAAAKMTKIKTVVVPDKSNTLVMEARYQEFLRLDSRNMDLFAVS